MEWRRKADAPAATKSDNELPALEACIDCLLEFLLTGLIGTNGSL